MEYFERSAMALIASPIILTLLFWSLAWKVVALWRAARNMSKNWFIVLLLVNTFGLLEILYMFVFSKKKN